MIAISKTFPVVIFSDILSPTTNGSSCTSHHLGYPYLVVAFNNFRVNQGELVNNKVIPSQPIIKSFYIKVFLVTQC